MTLDTNKPLPLVYARPYSAPRECWLVANVDFGDRQFTKEGGDVDRRKRAGARRGLGEHLSV